MNRFLFSFSGVEVYRIQRTASKNLLKSPWAVKRVTRRALAEGNQVYNKRIIDEAEILRRLKHPNVIGFRSIVKDHMGRDVLALEDCDISLGDVLEKRFDEELGALECTKASKVILDISRALDYCHTTALILHGDIKSHNILIKGEFSICKLCDFGVSLPLNQKGEVDLVSSPLASYVGTQLWSAPEVFEEDPELITTKTDVFSFGMMIYEMITCSPPHMTSLEEPELSQTIDLTNTSDEGSFNQSVEIPLTQNMGKRPALPDLDLGKEYNKNIEIFFLCTNEMAEDRPSAKVIVQAFEE